MDLPFFLIFYSTKFHFLGNGGVQVTGITKEKDEQFS